MGASIGGAATARAQPRSRCKQFCALLLTRLPHAARATAECLPHAARATAECCRVVQYHPDGEPLSVVGSRGDGPGELDTPVACAAARDGSGGVYIADAGDNPRVQLFVPEG